MCGIAGAWHQDGSPISEAALIRARDAITQRGPDDAGHHIEGPVGLAHRRLSIIDLSPAGRMPMFCDDGRVWAVFNGEVYNFESLRKELEARGRTFKSRTDSEVVLHAYAEWGLDCFARFNGMFALAVYDGRTDELVLARDVTGQKPLYYHHVPGKRLVFGSGLSPIRAWPDFPAEVDRDAVFEYMRVGYVPSPRSIFKETYRVPPGTAIVFKKNGSKETHRYFDLRKHAEAPRLKLGNDEAYVDELHRLLSDATRIRMIADVPLGAFLSGGLDSSLIVALMAEHRAKVQTFTIGFAQKNYDESTFAHKVAKHLGVDNTMTVLTGDDILAQLPDIVHYFDEPMADYSVLPTLAVSKLARRHVTVALTGDGADEEFGGYRYYLATRVFEQYEKIMPGALRGPLKRVARRVPQAGVRRVIDRSDARDVAEFFAQGGFYRGPTARGVPMLLKGRSKDSMQRIADTIRGCRTPSGTEAGLLYDATHTLPGAWLHKVDRASMAVALEARSPFLDKRVVEFAFRIPLDLRVRATAKKYVVRQLLKRYLPDELVDRPKQGFTAPVAKWLREDLRDQLRDALSPEQVKARGYFEPGRVDAIVKEHLDGAHDHAQILWALFTLEQWHRHHVDQVPEARGPANLE